MNSGPVPFLLSVCGQYLIHRFYHPVHAHLIELISELGGERSPLYTVDFVPFWRDENVGEYMSVVLVVMITQRCEIPHLSGTSVSRQGHSDRI